MSSLSFLTNEMESVTKFYSESINQKLNMCLEQCYLVASDLGNILNMPPRQLNYIVSNECSKTLGSCDEEIFFITGLICTIIYNTAMKLNSYSFRLHVSETSVPPGFEHINIIKDTPLEEEVSEIQVNTSYAEIARRAGVDDDLITDDVKSQVKEFKKPHFFKYVGETGFVDPLVVDDYLEEEGSTVFFITNGVSEEDVENYLMKNFPRTEYFSKFIPWEEGNYRVRISFNGISSAEKIDSMISSKLETREYVDIFTTYSYKKFMENLGDLSRKYFTTSKQIDDRILSIRFMKFVNKEFVFPTRKDLLDKFKIVGDGKVPVAFVYNMPLDRFNSLKKNTIWGYKFILIKKQPEDSNLRSLMVFKGNN